MLYNYFVSKSNDLNNNLFALRVLLWINYGFTLDLLWAHYGFAVDLSLIYYRFTMDVTVA